MLDQQRQLQSSASAKLAPFRKTTSTTTAHPICSLVDDFHFQRSVLLTFQGRPGHINDTDIVTLQRRAMSQVYNQVAACRTSPGGFLNILQVNISRNEVDSFGSTISETASQNITRQFHSQTVRGACRGCQATSFRLFSSTSPSRQGRSLTTSASTTSLPAYHGGSTAKRQNQLSAVTK